MYNAVSKVPVRPPSLTLQGWDFRVVRTNRIKSYTRPIENQPPIPSQRVLFVGIQTTQDHPIRLRYTRFLPCGISYFFLAPTPVRGGASTGDGMSGYTRYCPLLWVPCGWVITTASLLISLTNWHTQASQSELLVLPLHLYTRMSDVRSAGRRVWTGAKIGQERAFQAKISFCSGLGTPIRQLFPLIGPRKAQRDEL